MIVGGVPNINKKFYPDGQLIDVHAVFNGAGE